MAPTLTPTQRWYLTLIAVCLGSVATVALPADIPTTYRLIPIFAALGSAQLLSFLKQTPEQQAADLSNLEGILPDLEAFAALPADQQQAIIAFLKQAATRVTLTTTTTTTTEAVPAPATAA